MSNTTQVHIVSYDMLVKKDHPYRKILTLLDFEKLCQPLIKKTFYANYAKGYGIVNLFKMLFIQFLENLSDRELEKYLQENTAGKFFCNVALTDKTPDHSVFGKARKRIGTQLLSQLFNQITNSLKSQGYILENLTFVDSTALISKTAVWNERDKIIAQKQKLSNTTISKVAADPQAKLGCKGKDKFFYGYKQHTSVDMESGIIHKVAITPGNKSDGKSVKHILPSKGAVYGDKGYCGSESIQTIQAKQCTPKIIKRNNMKNKDYKEDAKISKLRMPFERVFSKLPKRVRYRGIAKNQFSAFMYALVHNIKRLLVLKAPPLILNS